VSFRVPQVNFSRGELGHQLYGRFDADAYQAGLKKARNVVVLKYGGVTKRPGTFYVAPVISGSTHRLIPFQFSIDQSYALEFGDHYMSPLADGGRVLDGVTPYQTVSPYSAGDLAEIDFEQTTDTMYLAHIDHQPTKLLRAGNTDWSFSGMTFGPSLAPPENCSVNVQVNNTDAENGGDAYFPLTDTYVVTAFNDDTGQESRASNSASAVNDLSLKRNYNVVSWDAVAGVTGYKVYKAHESGLYGYIGTTADLELVDDNIGAGLDQAPPAAFNPFSGEGDYPSTVTLFEQRTVWGRSRNSPNAIWTSRTGLLENMDRSRPLRADDSITLGIVAGRVNAVNQLVSTSSLMALTSDAIFTIDGDGNGGVLTANNPPAARRQVGRGCSRLSPLVVDNVVFYTPSVGLAVRTINYSFELDGLKSNDVSIFSPHFFSGFGIVSWCYAQEPRSLIWAVRDDGKLLCFTWEQEQNVWGWTLCETDGSVKSVCAISEGGEDRVYLIIERANGIFVERLASHTWDAVEDCCFLDSAVAGEFETPQSTVTGLDHLEGQTVSALVDGAVVADLIVSGGSVTLPNGITGRKITVGLRYHVDVQSLPLRLDLQGVGSTLGRRQQTGEIVLSLSDTRSIEAGIDEDHLFYVKSRQGEAYGSPDGLMNGEYVVSADNKAGTNAGVYIRQTMPLPFTLLGVALDPAVNG
jgi:hypothetical protein